MTRELVPVIVGGLLMVKRNDLIELYETLGRLEKAEAWRVKLPQKEAVDE